MPSLLFFKCRVFFLLAKMKAQKLELRIDWGDLDLLGHVNNVSIVRYCQAARLHFITAIDLTPTPGMSFGPIEAAASLQFQHQLHFPGNITIYTTIQEIKHTSFILEHRIFDDQGVQAVYCTEVVVCFDFVNQVKVPIPDRIRANIAAYTDGFTDEIPSGTTTQS